MSMTLEQVRDWHLARDREQRIVGFDLGATNHRGMADAIDAHLAQPRAVPDGCETVKSNSLPPGYRLGHSKKDGGYWPLLKDGYIGTGWYATQAEAELVAWKHAHGKLDSYMREIRRLAAAPSPGESE